MKHFKCTYIKRNIFPPYLDKLYNKTKCSYKHIYHIFTRNEWLSNDI